MSEPSPNGDIQGMHIIVIGAGLAGLAAAISTKIANGTHKVTVCEAVRELLEVGVSRPSPNQCLQKLKRHW